MGKMIDITGQRFGRLVVVGKTDVVRSGHRLWNVVCDCGSARLTTSQNLRSGTQQSCGCLQRELSRERMKVQARTHGMTDTGTWRTWMSMRQRCECEYTHAYPRYAGRGITVCERWQSFENFLADMGERPPGTTLDRYPDKDGNYEPGNCRWATPQQQNDNRAATLWIELDGKRMTLKRWAEHLGMNYGTLFGRLRKGWSPERTLRTPIDKRFSHHNNIHAARAVIRRAELRNPSRPKARL